MKLWKCLGENRMPFHGGKGQWPELWQWLAVDGKLDPCRNGLHLCTRGQVINWLSAEIYEAESNGEIVVCIDKVVARRARLVCKTAWTRDCIGQFAADCAEHVAHLYNNLHLNDTRVTDAIVAARGRDKKIADAASAAADAASAAAYAAYAAAYAAASAAAYAGYAAASATAYADYVAAHALEREWQTDRLFSYLYPDNSDCV